MPRTGNQWDQRIERARDLAKTCPYSSEILGFYSKFTAFQKDSYFQIQSAYSSRCPRSTSLQAALDGVDFGLLMPRWNPFLSMIAREAPVPLAEFARDLNARGPSDLAAILRRFWSRDRSAAAESDGDVGTPPVDSHAAGSQPRATTRVGPAPYFERFCAQAFLQPYAEFLAAHADLPEPPIRPRTCSYCGSPPLVGVLRQEGDGAARSLVCSFCRTEWAYLRIACPACDERDERRMRVYRSAAFDGLRVEACDTCRSYINTVDLTKNGLAIPEVDELAAIPLTLWADENGYSKVTRNAVGL